MGEWGRKGEWGIIYIYYVRLFLLLLSPSSGSSASELLDPLSLSELLPSFSDVSLISPSTSPVSSASSVCVCVGGVCGWCVCGCMVCVCGVWCVGVTVHVHVCVSCADLGIFVTLGWVSLW